MGTIFYITYLKGHQRHTIFENNFEGTPPVQNILYVMMGMICGDPFNCSCLVFKICFLKVLTVSKCAFIFKICFFQLGLLQVNLCQKCLFPLQLTHNMTTDCSMHYEFSTRKLQEHSMSRTCQEHLICTNCLDVISFKQRSSKINQIAYFLDDNVRNHLIFLFKP